MSKTDRDRPLSRRDWLRTAGAFGVGALLPLPTLRASTVARARDLPPLAEAALQGMCVVTPALTEGPYYVNTALLRTDIREGKPGLPMILYYMVVRASTCDPIAGAAVDIWHCDAGGVYSGVAAQGTVGQTFLRGIQITGGNGLVRFDTIYAGYYPGRTVHNHLKVHLPSGETLTTQTYFDDAITDVIFQHLTPYNGRPARTARNGNDPLFRSQNTKFVLPNPNGSFSVVAGLVIGVA